MMTPPLDFRPYQSTDRTACLSLFDANCPEFFAPNERQDYVDFLADRSAHYQVALLEDRIVGAFGVLPDEPQGVALRWILLSPEWQGQGLGARIMTGAVGLARSHGAATLYIGASHRSAPFFAKFGAYPTATIPDGWGPGMHRVDMLLKV